MENPLDKVSNSSCPLCGSEHTEPLRKHNFTFDPFHHDSLVSFSDSDAHAITNLLNNGDALAGRIETHTDLNPKLIKERSDAFDDVIGNAVMNIGIAHNLAHETDPLSPVAHCVTRKGDDVLHESAPDRMIKHYMGVLPLANGNECHSHVSAISKEEAFADIVRSHTEDPDLRQWGACLDRFTLNDVVEVALPPTSEPEQTTFMCWLGRSPAWLLQAILLCLRLAMIVVLAGPVLVMAWMLYAAH